MFFTVRGKEPVKLGVKYKNFRKILTRISNGKLIYSGVIEPIVQPDHATVNFYLLLTVPGSRGHHFLEWEESVFNLNGTWKSESIIVVFTPYVRTDNLKSLFDE